MNKKNLIVVVAGLALAVGLAAQGQDNPLQKEIPTNMKPYFMVYMVKGTKELKQGSPEWMQMMVGHLKWIRKMSEERKLALAGPMQSEGRVLGIGVFRAASKDEVVGWLKTEPSVRDGNMDYEIQACFLPDLDSVKLVYSK